MAKNTPAETKPTTDPNAETPPEGADTPDAGTGNAPDEVKALKGELVKAADLIKDKNKVNAEQANRIDQLERELAQRDETISRLSKTNDAMRTAAAGHDTEIHELRTKLETFEAGKDLKLGEGYAVTCTRATPSPSGGTYPVGTVIGTINPMKGHDTFYLVDAVRGGYAKCVKNEAK